MDTTIHQYKLSVPSTRFSTIHPIVIKINRGVLYLV